MGGDNFVVTCHRNRELASDRPKFKMCLRELDRLCGQLHAFTVYMNGNRQKRNRDKIRFIRVHLTIFDYYQVIKIIQFFFLTLNLSWNLV